MNAAETRVTMCHVVTDADLVPENHYHDHGGEHDGNVDVGDPPCAWRGRNKGQDRDDPSQRSLPVRRRRLRRRHVRAGFLLRLMDACACSSAERFSGRSSVTLSLDDVTFDDPELAPGEIITFQGQVNAAWNTSLEAGVLCKAEDPGGWEEGIGLHHSASSSKVEDGKDSEDYIVGGKGIEKQWQKRRKVCSAYFTFVALDNDGKRKAMLPPLASDSDECVRRRLMAEERRSIRFRRKDIIAQATLRYAAGLTSLRVCCLTHLRRSRSPTPAAGTEGPMGGGQAAVVFTELVLPPHANHHGNTFGGQIMYWMVRAAEVAASRHAGAAVFVHGVDDVFFVGPSRVGDRVELSARPVRCFGLTIEVSLAVYAYGLDSSDRRLINRAYFVLHVVKRGGGSIKDEGGGIGLDDDGPSHGYVLPDLYPTTASEVAEYDRALGRRALRFERFAVRSSEFERDRLRAWTFRGMPADLCALNVKTLLGVYLGGNTWEKIKVAARAGLKGSACCGIYFKVERGSIRCKVTMDLPLGIEAVDVFNLLLDVQRRTEWDGYLVSAECLENIDENNDIQRFVFRVRNEDDRLLRVKEDSNDENETGGGGDGNSDGNGNGCMELILLRSWRRDYSEGDVMVIANHSIQHPNAPAAAEGSSATPRAFVGSSGWIVQRRKNWGGSDSSGGGGGGLGSVSLTYIVTLGPSSSRIAKDVVLGRSEVLCNNMDQIVRLLTD